MVSVSRMCRIHNIRNNIFDGDCTFFVSMPFFQIPFHTLSLDWLQNETRKKNYRRAGDELRMANMMIDFFNHKKNINN